MWKIVRICEGVYGFSAEPNLNDAYSATCVIKIRGDRMEIMVEVYMSYFNNVEHYENLLKEIRHFVEFVKIEQNKDVCTVNFHCQGLSCFTGEKPLPTHLDSYNWEVIDWMFNEEIV